MSAILQTELDERVIEVVAWRKPAEIAIGNIDRPTTTRWIHENPDEHCEKLKIRHDEHAYTSSASTPTRLSGTSFAAAPERRAERREPSDCESVNCPDGFLGPGLR